ncbi:MAG TPA: hypothetical protein VJU83_07870 [Burkholderiales bacterium]|nr:hypothetical protein [Burkholderiales bacterium]
MTEAIGWGSAAILLYTIVRQVQKQWTDTHVEGVSASLFIGQTIAAAGFTVYSYLVENWVFVATNAFIFISALIGQGLFLRNKRRAQ